MEMHYFSCYILSNEQQIMIYQRLPLSLKFNNIVSYSMKLLLIVNTKI